MNASATVTAIVNQAPNAGGDSELTICEGSGAVDLFTVLVGPFDLNGTWVEQSTSGQLSGSFFDPTGLPPGVYQFEYTVDGNGQCGDDEAHVEIIIVAQLDAGSNSTTSTCGSNMQVNLFNLLGGSPDPGGTWVDLDLTGEVTGQFFNAFDAGAGVYHFRYRLVGAVGCDSDSALVTLTVVAPPNAGTNGSTITCSSASSFSMVPFLGGSPQVGGTWHVGSPGGAGHGASYNPAIDTSNDFYYVVGGNPPCSSASARVTVTEVQEANAGNNAFATVCSNGAAFNMFSLLTGNPNTGGSWFFNNQNHSATFDPSIDVQGVYEYRVPGQPPCPVDIATLTISVTLGANAGCNSSATVCSDDSAFLLFNVLTCNPQNGGSWRGPDLLPHNGTYTPGTSVPGDYLYIIVGVPPCSSDTTVVSVFENDSPDAGGNGSGSYCSTDPSVNLGTLLTGNPDPFGTWVGPAPGNPPFSGIFTPGISAPGAYTYTVTNSCGSDNSTVTVVVTTPPNAGCNNTVTTCNNGGIINMLSQLGCAPAPGGTWTGPLPSTAVVGGFFQPGLSVPGTYRYRVAGSGACADAFAFLTVNVNTLPNAGNDNSLQVCNTAGQVNLFPLLGASAQPGGSWYYNSVTPHSGILNPATDLSGSYVYRLTGVAPCASDSATVQVQVAAAPNAGNDGLAETCSDNGPFALINFITGGPQLNGDWTDPVGAPHSGIYAPATNASGLYEYRVPGNAGCPADSAYVTVIENQAVDAGGSAVTVVCSNAPPFDLFNLLTGSPGTGGTWYQPSGAITISTYVPGVSQPGIYKYKLVGTAPCENDSATVTVVQNTAANAGISRLVAACSSHVPFALVDSLGGIPDNNGAWTFNGQPHGPFFDPATDAPGPYVYTVLGAAPCATVVAQVVVTVTEAESAGSDGTLTACVGADAIALPDGLEGEPSPGGSWTNNCGSGVLVNGVFDATGFASGSSCTFTYTHAADGPCPAVSALVTLNVVNALDAGSDSTSQACQGQFVDLFNALGGTPQAGNYWVNVDNAPGLFGSVFNTGAVAPGTVWRFDHILPGSAQCDADTARVTINVLDGPYAGNDDDENVCSNSAPVILSTTGGPDPGGTWFDPSWLPHSGTFVAATDDPGDYHYVVAGVGACPADSAIVTVSLISAADAGADAPLVICSTDAAVNMFDLLGPNAQTGGNWVYVTGGNVQHNEVYNPAIDAPIVYRYCVVGTPPCPTDCNFITVTENAAPDAGENDEVTVCTDDGNFSMRGQLGGTPATNGSWVYVTGGDIPHGDFFDPGVDLPGIYRYTVAGTAPCAEASALLTVNVVTAGNAGQSATVDACVTQFSVDIFDALGPSAQSGGIWTDVNGSQALTGNIFNPNLAGNGSWPFIYTVLGSGPCPTVTATITVEVGAGSSAGIDSTISVCGSITDYDLFTALGGSPTPGGTWSAPSGGGSALQPGGILNVSLLPIGGATQFVYTIEDPGCGNVSASVFVTATDFPVAGGGASLTLCSTASPIDLFAQLTGSPQAGGVWTDPTLQVHGSSFVPASDAEGDYTYTVIGIAPCANATATISIIVNEPPNAGTNGELLACDTLTALSLFTGLQGTPQPGGAWEDLDGSGGLTGGSLNTTLVAPGEYYFRYTVSVAGCGSTTALVKVIVVTSVDVIDVVRTCIERDRTYTVSFTIEQGDPNSYEVTGLEGTISTTEPYVFTSTPIFTSESFEAFIRDQYGCGTIRVSGDTPCDFEEDVFIPETFSPNGDGVNELFLIPGIEGYPTNTILIFNRWGAKMYEATGYNNGTVVWDGTSSDAAIAGPAPAGTYYYVLDLDAGGDVLTGYIYLNR
ncbi:MAG: gliding motility-associated C-terminal domain-containing protein [Flavobacteriales bacterium]|nr:gliding motility-associated C-terminal domain-containing protein [Flavobacteriales bacterium]